MKIGPLELKGKELWIVVIVTAFIVFLILRKAWNVGETVVDGVSDFVTDQHNPVNETYEALGGPTGSDLYDLGHDEDGKANWFGRILDAVTGQTELTEQTERLHEATHNDQDAAWSWLPW